MKRIILAVLALASLAMPAKAMQIAYTTALVSGPVASSGTYILDLNATRIDNLSIQAAYSSATLNTASFIDGRPSTATVTVVSTQPLVGIQGSDFVNVLSTNGLSGAAVNLNGKLLFNNGWRINFASFTAIDVMNEINAQPGYGVSASTSAPTIVKLQCLTVGTFCNAFTLSIVGTSSLTATTANFTGGQDPAVLQIAGRQLIAGTGFAVGTPAVTATNIAAGINADPVLNQIMVATAPANSSVVFATSSVVGVNAFAIGSSNQAALSVSSNTFLNGAASAVQTTNSSLLLPSHGFATGTALLFTKTTGTPPGTLLNNTTYFAIVLDANDIQLASSNVNAVAGTPIVAITTQTAAGAGSFSLAPLAIVGPLGLSWQASDDSLNWAPLTTPNGVAVASVTFAVNGAATSTYWDFGLINARFIRLNVVGPSQGAYNLTVTPYGKGQAYGY